MAVLWTETSHPLKAIRPIQPEGTRAEADLPRFDKTIKTTLTLETRSASAEGARIVGGKNRLLNVRQRASTVNVNN